MSPAAKTTPDSQDLAPARVGVGVDWRGAAAEFVTFPGKRCSGTHYAGCSPSMPQSPDRRRAGAVWGLQDEGWSWCIVHIVFLWFYLLSVGGHDELLRLTEARLIGHWRQGISTVRSGGATSAPTNSRIRIHLDICVMEKEPMG
jgi:hypothetical protein